MRIDKASFAFVAALFVEMAWGDIVEVSSLDFGTVAVSQNSTPGQVDVSFTGLVNYTGGIYGITAPSRGEFFLSNFPNNQSLFITGSNIQATTNSDSTSQDQFTLDSINVPSVITTDSSGNATLYVGGVLETSADGTNNYTNTRYTISYQISVNY
ncbi:MAG: hypothetical protein CMG93_15630 [Marinomonas sp.]|jgi:hypothetical protein|uniref:Uncharacterized protein DUF4402 n=1 Tax=Marinomonas communis TaxID=28254 RepID=A0A4R6XC87_9GAMM|nr:DUF4402 domain-containing protein [Marinomonas communis]MAF17379.1 hypothetical protein [Marinomonas sp.]MCC4272937.1 DUF4402 domain-containing protein [Marinomonas communis]RUM50140.1 MAG: hypothetical protein DSY85_14095 [Marinomonas sp.]RUM51442.1 MAG: hypothetical protein DSY86_06105 [Marinomonas sp.]TDR15749.1 uncharacterized protein DUF4402 [Marinomonas communis]